MINQNNNSMFGDKLVEISKCCMCERNFDKEDLKHIEIKGKVKDICNECITSIKGLI